MSGSVVHSLRLAKAGIVLAQHGVRLVPKGMPTPLPLKLLRIATAPIHFLSAPFRWRTPRSARLSTALIELGPSYVKLGQFLSTRADILPPDVITDLRHLQDKAPPFPMAEARLAVERALGGKLEDHFVEFGPPVAAASIAQVHKAAVMRGGVKVPVAVKILRPDIEKRFKRDLDSYFFAASQIERFVPQTRRLKPVAVVENLKHTTDLEMDLRLEAAAISEMAGNLKPEDGIRVPTVDWQRTAKRVLTLEWIDGTPISDRDALRAKGFDLEALGLTVIRGFLRHAMRDGFFHADMHQGNLFVDANGQVVAVDFGIMGRIGATEQRFLAEILHGLITRDYYSAAAIHFEAGYVPPQHTVEEFAQAMRAIGEPIHGKTAEQISMADLLGQLFMYTDVFDMETRPELILLQKSMVIVEGVARDLDPRLNMWTAAEPVARAWMEDNLGLAGRLNEAGHGARELASLARRAPALLAKTESVINALSDRANADALFARQSSAAETTSRRTRWALVLAAGVAAVSLAAMALRQYGIL